MSKKSFVEEEFAREAKERNSDMRSVFKRMFKKPVKTTSKTSQARRAPTSETYLTDTMQKIYIENRVLTNEVLTLNEIRKMHGYPTI